MRERERGECGGGDREIETHSTYLNSRLRPSSALHNLDIPHRRAPALRCDAQTLKHRLLGAPSGCQTRLQRRATFHIRLFREGEVTLHEDVVDGVDASDFFHVYADRYAQATVLRGDGTE